ncbi:hypothetical protein ABT324_27980, partial [Saccharopolyspora sp. NPDC000359]|uniref:hypothetical protein n=1 Tax=Saccharopolyspora sp. NPDC000359 TaxID=3154251 RepID=UPI003332B1D9
DPSTAREGVGFEPSTARAEKAQVNPSTAREGVGFEPSTARAEKAQVNPSTAREGVASKEEIGDLSGRREISDLSIERDAASLRKAGDAAPEDDELTAAVRQLVNRLPWETTSKGRNAKVMTDANTVLVPAIVAAIRNGWVTLAQAQEHALRKITEAGTNPVLYVTNGFAADRIPLPTPDDVLPLPDPQTPEKAPQRPARGANGTAGTSGVGDAGVVREGGSEPGIGCAGCVESGTLGWVQRADGRWARCRCNPVQRAKSA